MTNIQTKTDPSLQQQRILDSLPATAAELAETLHVTKSTVYTQLKRLEAKGYSLTQDADYAYDVAGVPGDSSQTQTETSDTESESNSEYTPAEKAPKAAITRAKNDHLYELERRLYDILDQVPAVRADGGLPVQAGHEDIVVHISDDHIGSLRRDEFGVVTFDDEIAAARIRSRTEKVFELADRQEAAGTIIDTVHCAMGGDLVDGEGIYELQPHEVCLTLDKQIDLAVVLYFEMIQSFAERFPAVQVVCQSGNHGELRMQSASQGANADTIVYLMLKRLLAASAIENVTLIHNESTNFINFEMRGGRWNAHLRHGQDCPAHIGTPSPKNKWQAWQQQHGFDIAYRGHYHEFRMEHTFGRTLSHPGEVRRIPVLMSGSIAPPADYEESIGVWGSPSGTIHGVSDENVMTWLYPIYY